MANPEAVGSLLQGVARWNDWRKTKDGPSLDLSGADLRDRDLTGADLRAVNLSGAILRGAKFGPGSLLWNANLSGADLYGANLRGADLQDVNFSGADLFQADLRETNLQGADLSAAKGGLLSKQLAGADLTGAKLPDPLAKLYDSLSSVKEISDSAQKLFLALLAGCLYSWLTIAQTTDVDLITNRASTPLPIIQATIPIVGFYVVTPLILLCLYFYFHFYLQKLWEELGSLPAVFPDGRLLHNRTDPWLLNDLVRSHFAKLKDGRPFLSYFQAWISVVLAWWLVPITLFLFWGRYLRRHDLFRTVFHSLLLTLAIFSAVRLYRIAGETLRGYERTVFRWKDVIKRRSTYLRICFATGLGAFLIAISVDAVLVNVEWIEHGPGAWVPRATWVPRAMRWIGYSPVANLTNADVSIKPPNWTGKRDEELELVKGAVLRGVDLRGAGASGAFLAKANLEDANLHGSQLIETDLRQSVLSSADLRRSFLLATLLQGSHMYRVLLDDANLDRANFTNADMTEASLVGAWLLEADFTHAILRHANLRESDLQQTNLTGTNLEGADLTNASFVSVPDALVEIKYADFRRTKGLKPDSILRCGHWQLAFYDSDMLKQLGLPPDHNEKLEQQMKAENAKAAPALPTAPKARH